MTNNTSFVYPSNTNEKVSSYMPGYGDVSLSNSPSVPYDYDNSKEATQDNAYIIFLLPNEARRIKEIVAKALDKLDYEGSVIYHEYPDKTNLHEIINEIHQQINTQMPQSNESAPNWMRQLIESIFFDEMINLRRKYFNKMYR